MMRIRPLFLCLILGMSVAARASDLAHPRLRVEGTAKGRCPDAAALQQRVAANLGLSPETLFTEPPDVELRVTMAARGKGFQATIDRFTALGNLDGTQTIFEPGESCSELATSLVLVLSIAIEPTYPPSPEAEPQASPPTPWLRPSPASDPTSRPASDPTQAEAKAPLPRPLGTTAVTALTATPPNPPPKPSPSPMHVPRFPMEYSLSGGGFAAYGLAPSAVGGAELEVEARHRWYGLALGGEATSIGGTAVQGTTGSLQAALFAGILEPCGHLRWLGVCARLVLGAEVSSASQNLEAPRTGAAPYLAAGARVFADIPLAPQLFLRPAATIEFPILQTALYANQTDLVWQQQAVALSGGVDLVLRLP